VSAAIPDKEVDGKIAVRKGGGSKDRLLASQRHLQIKVKAHWQERQNKKPRRGDKK